MEAEVVDVAGKKFAMLPVEDYQRLLEIEEDFEDVVAAELARARREAGEEYVPAEHVNRIIDGESALKVWREHRELTQEGLAAVVGCSTDDLDQIEKGAAPGEPKVWRALAEALGVELEDIVPLD